MTKSIKLGIVFLFDIFRGSSMVEQLPVKELVVGSSPTRGAQSWKEPEESGFWLALPVAELFK